MAQQTMYCHALQSNAKLPSVCQEIEENKHYPAYVTSSRHDDFTDIIGADTDITDADMVPTEISNVVGSALIH